MNKFVASPDAAVADIEDGAVIMVGGFGGSGTPHNLTRALLERGTKGLTVISNSINPLVGLLEHKRIRKLICSFPTFVDPNRPNPFEVQYRAGEAELELVPQGTLAERIRAGGAGIPAFYTPSGVGTVVEAGKEKRVIKGEECLLEFGLTADFSLVKAFRADRLGNLTFRMASRNFNPIMATAGRVTIAEVEELVSVGELSPEHVVTPGIFVHRVTQASKIAVWVAGRQ